MAQIAPIYRKFVPQLLHMIVLPVFFFTFMLVYRPFDIEPFLGSEWFGVHLTIISCIVLFCAIVTRTAYYFIPMRIDVSLIITPLALLLRAKSSGWLKELDKTMDNLFE